MLQPSAQATYAILIDNLGKDFVDQSLLKVLGFDNALDIAQSDNFALQYGENASISLPGQIANIISDVPSAITFAKDRMMTAVKQQEQYYYGDIDKDRSGETIDDIKLLLNDMMDDMTTYLDNNTILDGFIDFMIIFRIDSVIRDLYPHLFGTSVRLVGRVGKGILLRSENDEKVFQDMFQDMKFGEKLLLFLERFLSKIKSSSPEEQSSIYIMSEFLRVQSGSSDGIGNGMNPMSQDYALDYMLGSYDRKDVQGLFPKMFFMIKQLTPKTKANIRKNIQDLLDELNTEYRFPKKYAITFNK